VFHPYAVGTELWCPTCGNKVKVEEIGGGTLSCSCGPLVDLHHP
jgi:hypothetical protein